MLTKVQIAETIDIAKCSERVWLLKSEDGDTTKYDPYECDRIIESAAHRRVEMMSDTSDDNYDQRLDEIVRTAEFTSDGIFITAPSSPQNWPA